MFKNQVENVNKKFIYCPFILFILHMWFSATHLMWFIIMLLSINKYRHTIFLILKNSIICHLKNFIHYRRTVKGLQTLRFYLSSTNRPLSVRQVLVPKMLTSSGRSFLALFYMSFCITDTFAARPERNFYIFVICLVHVLDRLFNNMLSSHIIFFLLFMRFPDGKFYTSTFGAHDLSIRNVF